MHDTVFVLIIEPAKISLKTNDFISRVVLSTVHMHIRCTHIHTLSPSPTHTHTHTQYLDLAQTLSDYSCLQFPHCACDARKVGHVMVTIGMDSIKLKACTSEGQYYMIMSSHFIDYSLFMLEHMILCFHITVSPIITKLQSFYSAKGAESNAANCASRACSSAEL